MHKNTYFNVLVLGEILVDKLPSGARPGGAPFNFARHLHRMGCDVFFASRIGDDSNGKILEETARTCGIDTRWIQRDAAYPTGRVEVVIDEAGVPEYTIADDTAYDHINFEELHTQLEHQPDLVYFGSLIQRTQETRNQLHTFLDKQSKSMVRMYDMNLRHGCIKPDIQIPSLQHADLLKLNEEELDTTGRMLALPGTNRGNDYVARSLMDQFELRQLALTRGSNGSVLYTQTGRFELGPGPLFPEDIVDTVGAGDAYAAGIAVGYLNKWIPEKTLRIATQLAERICTVAGAVPSDSSIYEKMRITNQGII